MRSLIVAISLFLGMALIVSPSHAIIYFQENFNTGDLPYSFSGYKFGYSDSPIQTYHDSTGGVNDSGTHRIPLGGPSRTNFDVYLGNSLPNLRSYYLRFYLWINSTFNTDPGANWKLTYNYTVERAGFVFWMRPTADGQGFQPAFFSSAHGSDILKTEPVPTFYFRDFKAQWVCFEYYVTLDAPQWGKVWITTQDGLYNQTLYINAPFTNEGTAFNSIKVGAYWDGTGDSNYFKVDEVVVSDQYIGPLGSSTMLARPANLRTTP